MEYNTEVHNILINDESYKLIIVNKKMKNFSIRITQDFEIKVSGNNVDFDKAMELVQKHKKWIVEKFRTLKEKKETSSVSDLQSFNKIYLFGTMYNVKETFDKNKNFHIEGDDFYVYCLSKLMKHSILEFLMDAIRDSFTQEIVDIFKKYKEIFGVKCSLKFKDMISKYGYCQANDNKIVLSKRLIHLPYSAIEYVVVHEFCHFKQHNHSSLFYKEVEKYLPDYKERVKLIKKYNLIFKA